MTQKPGFLKKLGFLELGKSQNISHQFTKQGTHKEKEEWFESN